MPLHFYKKLICILLALTYAQSIIISAQTTNNISETKTIVRYVDQTGGITADEAVRIALENNGELQALRKELEAARALIKQARLRANPSHETNGTKQIGGADNSLMTQAMLPLELGGRRRARILVAEREAAVREKAVEEKERQLAADVRMKFGEALAQTLKLRLTEDLLA